MWRKARAQPKDAFEQPETVSEDVDNVNTLQQEGGQSNRALLCLMKSIEEELPISLFTGEPYDPEWFGGFTPAPKANPSIISKVWK